MAYRKLRKKKGRRDGSSEQYMNLPYAWVRADAWRSLGGAALKVFVELRGRFNGGNNGKLFLAYQEASDLLGLGRATIKRAFDELETKGFLVKTQQGQWYGRRATLWRITMLACDGTPATHDWKNWRQEKKQKAVLARNRERCRRYRYRTEG